MLLYIDDIIVREEDLLSSLNYLDAAAMIQLSAYYCSCSKFWDLFDVHSSVFL